MSIGHERIDKSKPTTLAITVPMRVVSEANTREHYMEKHKRAKAQKGVVAAFLRSASPLPELPARVTLTRVYCGRAKAMDSDNLARAFKATRDSIANHYCRDDGSDCYDWRVAQERGDDDVVRITIESLDAKEMVKA